MLLINIMAQANWEFHHLGYGNYWAQLSEKEKLEQYGGIRDAVMALVRSNIPRDVIKAGVSEANQCEDAEWAMADGFRAMLLKILEPKEQQAQTQN